MNTAGETIGQYVPSDYYKRQTALHHSNGDLTKAREIYAFLIEGADTSSGPVAEAVKAPKKETKGKTTADTKLETAGVREQVEEAKTEAVLDYAKDVQPVVLKAGAHNRAATLKLISDLGAGHAKDVAVEKRAELVAGCEKILEAAANA